MNYTRKRALLACDFCRHRKRRCDGERPCSTCRESNADCRYKDLPIERVDSPSAANEALVERLGRIEALLEEQGHQLQNLFDSKKGAGGTLESPTSFALDPTDIELAGAPHTSSAGPSTSRFSNSYLHRTTDAVATVAAETNTSLSSAASPAATSRSPGNINPPLDLDIVPNQASFTHHPSIPYHAASTGNTTAASLSPAFGFGAATPLNSGAPFISGVARPIIFGRAQSAGASDVSSHNVEQEQFLMPYEHSTAANTLLSLPLVRFFLKYIDDNNKKHTEKRRGGESSPLNSFYYPRTYFFDIEKAQPLPPELDLIYGPGLAPPIWPPPVLTTSHPAVLQRLAASYFTFVHPNAPLFSLAEFHQWSAKLYATGPNTSVETAICLIVWALGSLAAQSGDSLTALGRQIERDQVALSLFQPAMKILLQHALWHFGPASLTVCQGLLLAASYFSYVGRPLHNARMVQLASQHLLRLLDEQKRDGLEPEANEKLVRAFWVCFIWECDRAAEFDIPRSGVEHLADSMPLPSSLDPDDSDNMICFAAETAVRRLFNRIHSSLYAPTGSNELGTESGLVPDSGSGSGRTTPGTKRKRDSEPNEPLYGTGTGYAASNSSMANNNMGKMLSISAELNRQLEAWYYAMPDHLKSRLIVASGSNDMVEGKYDYGNEDSERDDDELEYSSTTATNERIKLLRIHYYAARHIIHRPFVLSVAWQQQQQVLLREGAVGDAATAAAMPSTASGVPTPLPAAVLEKCATCVDSCAAYLMHVMPLLDRRSMYLWSFCQSSMACLLVLLVAEACPAITLNRIGAENEQLRSIDVGRLRDQVSRKLRRWAVPGSGFEAELRILESLPIRTQSERRKPRNQESWKVMKQEVD